jgi:8-oxo-dGTP pyrophosphatase MutT (NUDIX family)
MGVDSGMVEIATLDPGKGIAFRPCNMLDIVEQAGALCLRDNGGVQEVLVISSLNTDRWGIPKGHVDPGEPFWMTAQREAFEEAGVVGTAGRWPIGGYFYRKSTGDQTFYVRVHRVEVREHAPDYPERNLRAVRWAPIEDAVSTVTRRGLRRLLQGISDSA